MKEDGFLFLSNCGDETVFYNNTTFALSAASSPHDIN